MIENQNAGVTQKKKKYGRLKDFICFLCCSIYFIFTGQPYMGGGRHARLRRGGTVQRGRSAGAGDTDR